MLSGVQASGIRPLGHIELMQVPQARVEPKHYRTETARGLLDNGQETDRQDYQTPFKD